MVSRSSQALGRGHPDRLPLVLEERTEMRGGHFDTRPPQTPGGLGPDRRVRITQKPGEEGKGGRRRELT
jgi:hypothetical protein